MIHKPFKSFIWNEYEKLAWVLAYGIKVGDELEITYRSGKKEYATITQVKPMYEKRIDSKLIQDTIEGVPLWLVKV